MQNTIFGNWLQASDAQTHCLFRTAVSQYSKFLVRKSISHKSNCKLRKSMNKIKTFVTRDGGVPGYRFTSCLASPDTSIFLNSNSCSNPGKEWVNSKRHSDCDYYIAFVSTLFLTLDTTKPRYWSELIHSPASTTCSSQLIRRKSARRLGMQRN